MSPCIRLCRLDDTGAYCLGCNRNLGEIAAWSKLTTEQKESVMSRLREQKAA